MFKAEMPNFEKSQSQEKPKQKEETTMEKIARKARKFMVIASLVSALEVAPGLIKQAQAEVPREKAKTEETEKGKWETTRTDTIENAEENIIKQIWEGTYRPEGWNGTKVTIIDEGNPKTDKDDACFHGQFLSGKEENDVQFIKSKLVHEFSGYEARMRNPFGFNVSPKKYLEKNLEIAKKHLNAKLEALWTNTQILQALVDFGKANDPEAKRMVTLISSSIKRINEDYGDVISDEGKILLQKLIKQVKTEETNE